MKKVVLHHTCSQDHGEPYVLANAPFLAKDDPSPQNRKYQFLGTGYYLWENDIEQAKYWGKKHYKNSFFVVEFECNVDERYILNLNEREGQLKYEEILNILENKIKKNKKTIDIKSMAISRVLQLLYSPTNNISFDYKAIKVRDAYSSERRQREVRFTSEKPNSTYFDFVCFYYFRDKRDMNVISNKIVK